VRSAGTLPEATIPRPSLDRLTYHILGVSYLSRSRSTKPRPDRITLYLRPMFESRTAAPHSDKAEREGGPDLRSHPPRLSGEVL